MVLTRSAVQDNDSSARSPDQGEASSGLTGCTSDVARHLRVKRGFIGRSTQRTATRVDEPGEGATEPVRELVENELEEEEDSATRCIATYSKTMSLILVGCAIGPMREVVFQRTLVCVFAVTVWFFPSYYCQVLQEYLDDPANEDRRFIWSRIGFYIHRTMGHDSRQFFGRAHGEPTDWSRAISCFIVNTFVACGLYMLSTVWVGDEKDVGILYETFQCQAVFWMGINTMHRQLPRPATPMFRLEDRILHRRHARSFMRIMKPLGLGVLVRLIVNNWGAVKILDGYAIAFTAVFGVDVVWYTLRLFTCDDAMDTLIGVPGTVTVEVTNLQYLMMGMLSKAVFLIKTLSMSDRAKKVWILVELVVQVVSLWAVSTVSKRYVPNFAGIPLRHHGVDLAAKMITLSGVSFAFGITWLGWWRPTG